MDGCKTKLIQPVIHFLNERFPDLNWTIEDVLTWNFSPNLEISKAAFEFMESPGFFRNLEPYHGSLEAYQESVQLGHQVIICTTPLDGKHRERCKNEKIEWIIEHLGESAAKSIEFSDNKTEIEADVIIDDKPHLTIGHNEVKFKNWLIVDQPYNRILPAMDHPPVGRINNDWSNWREEFAKVGLL